MKTTVPGKMAYQRDEHRIHLIVCHLICCPKRRKPILTGKMKDRLIELVQQKCAEKGWDIRELARKDEKTSSGVTLEKPPWL